MKYLLTWYGITDLKASLNMIPSGGPIHGALATEAYDGIVVLAYTNPENEALSSAERAKLLNTVAASDEEYPPGFWRVANTSTAHHHYHAWLTEQAEQLGLTTEIHLQSVVLEHLHDTRGIYNIAVQSLNLIASMPGTHEVTLFLSPGTPVMAFVWAFSALGFPTLARKLIVSSRPDHPPQEIKLPAEWLEQYGQQVRPHTGDPSHFDAIVHLSGIQRMPGLLGIRQFHCGQHIFVTSKNYPTDVMKRFIDSSQWRELYVAPYDPVDVQKVISDYLKNFSSHARIGFNLTGGTKLMYAGAYAACRRAGGEAFYFDRASDEIVYLDSFRRKPTRPINSIDTFFKLHADALEISHPGYWDSIPGINNPEREKLTRMLWRKRRKIAQLYRQIVKFNESNAAFNLHSKNIILTRTDSGEATINLEGQIFHFEHWPNISQYLSGGWLEEYVYLSLKPYLKSNIIKDLRIGLELSVSHAIKKTTNAREREQLYQELDVVFTDGRRLYIVECKAGSLNSDHVMKLQNITRHFGGSEGKGIFAACFPPHSKVSRKKIRDARNLGLIAGKSFDQDLEDLMQTLSRTTAI